MLSMYIGDRAMELTENLSLVNATKLGVDIQRLLIKRLQQGVHEATDRCILALLDNLGTSLFGVWTAQSALIIQPKI